LTNKQNNFTRLKLSQENINNLNSLGFKTMTPIQEQSLPLILDGVDIIAKAKTGSGKTISFGLGVLNNLNVKDFRIQALILLPTRELAAQVAKTLKNLARFQHNIKILTLAGGVPYKPQVHSLSHQAHIIVGTPGRVLKHLEQNNFSPKDINTLVLDEADRMLDMGFNEDINLIINYLPQNRQTMLFSATYPNSIEQLSKSILKDPVTIEVEAVHSSTTIKQQFYETLPEQKDSLILKVIDDDIKSVIIFCNTKIKCDQLADTLESYDLEPLLLHSDMEQKYRDETLILFANKSYPILIATDVASRGLDIDDVDLVINYDLPTNLEVFTHRIGRTARGNKNGLAISFVDNLELFEELQDFLDTTFMLQSSTTIQDNQNAILKYDYSTLYINGGKTHKLRAGDILGALTAGIGLDKNEIGKIDILPTCSYVAIKNNVYQKAFDGLNKNKMKNRYFKAYKR
jgi:ATP-independent RNA helicase DbpA